MSSRPASLKKKKWKEKITYVKKKIATYKVKQENSEGLF
jgi:hypothetical protein